MVFFIFFILLAYTTIFFILMFTHYTQVLLFLFFLECQQFKVWMVKSTSSAINSLLKFIKSGLLLDFFIKRICILIGFILFKVFNIDYSEKLFVERLFLKFSIFSKFFKSFLDMFSNNFTFVILPSILLIICIFFSFLVLIIRCGLQIYYLFLVFTQIILTCILVLSFFF